MCNFKRTPNFTTEKEERLLLLVKKYTHIVECKSTDNINNKYLTKYYNVDTAKVNTFHFIFHITYYTFYFIILYFYIICWRTFFLNYKITNTHNIF